MVWFGLVWFGLVWFGLGWFGLVWFGLVWFGLDWIGLDWFNILYNFDKQRFLHESGRRESLELATDSDRLNKNVAHLFGLKYLFCWQVRATFVMFGTCFLDTLLTCLGHVWDIFLTCLGHVWDMFGVCLGCVWDVFGTSLWKKIKVVENDNGSLGVTIDCRFCRG